MTQIIKLKRQILHLSAFKKIQIVACFQSVSLFLQKIMKKLQFE